MFDICDWAQNQDWVVFTDLVIRKPKSLFDLHSFAYYTIVLSDIIQ